MNGTQYVPEVEEHLKWVRNNSVNGTCGDEPKPFLPTPVLQSHFQENDNANLRRLLQAVKVNVLHAKTIAKSHCAVFAILLRIQHAEFIVYFLHHDISDAKLPLPLTKSPEIPESAEADFYERFRETQWAYCVQPLRPFTFRKFENDRILPFEREDNAFNEQGSSARIFKIQTSEHYPLQEKSRTLALKAYFDTDGEENCNTEENAYQRLKRKRIDAVIDFFVSFRHGDHYYTILEYADGGSLEDLFQEPEPKWPAEILTFYERLLGLCTAIMHIVDVQEPRNSEHIWHQDIKPENILVVSCAHSNASDSFPWKFKLADFGASHFKKLPFSNDRDSRGSATYGAPECYRSDEDVMQLAVDVSPKVDIWSLGAVLSEAVVWVVFGTLGLKRFRRERANETKDIWIHDDDCFHDGRTRLSAVERFLEEAKLSSRTSDFATKLIVDLILTLLLVPQDGRLTAQLLHSYSKLTLDRARKYQGGLKNESLKLMYPQYNTPATPYATENGLYRSIVPVSRMDYSDPQIHHTSRTEDLSPYQDPHSQTPVDSAPSPRSQHTSEANIMHYTMNGQPMSPGDSLTFPSTATSRPESIIPPNNVTRDQPSGYSTPRLEIPPENNPLVQARAAQNVQPDSVDPTNVQNAKADDTKLRVSSDRQNALNNSSASSTVYQQSQKPQDKAIHESPGEINQLGLEQLREWYNRVKLAKSSFPFIRSNSCKEKLIHSDLMAQIKGKDYVFLIDDAASMKNHWSNVQHLFPPLVYLIKLHKLDKDGQDLYFATNRKQLIKQKNTKKLIKTVMSMETSTVHSDLPARLDEILHEYQLKLRGSKTSRGLQIYVLTDGKWQGESDRAAEGCIQSFVETLVDTNQPQKSVGIQFIRFGDDPGGTARLNRLDTLHRSNPEAFKRDIVDTVPWNGNVWKILIGATNDTYDLHAEDDDIRNG